MKKSFVLLLLGCLCLPALRGQDRTSSLVGATETLVQLHLSAFFDNTEFRHSQLEMPQTMAGVHVAPGLGLRWNGTHTVMAGVDLLKEFGSERLVDYSDLMAYYRYEKDAILFTMGAFPREDVTGDYPRLFFSDSIRNYRPMITGFCWSYREEASYFKAWLDWSFRQTTQRHEAFFMGESFRLDLGTAYLQHFGYMYHFAGVKDPPAFDALHDNGLYLTSVGSDLTSWMNLGPIDKLDFSLGWVAGVEDARGTSDWVAHHALLAKQELAWWRLGLENNFYLGEGQMIFYEEHGNLLYWGDRLFRANLYNRTDLKVNFINSPAVNVRLLYSLHAAEGTVYHEQALYATVRLNAFKKR